MQNALRMIHIERQQATLQNRPWGAAVPWKKRAKPNDAFHKERHDLETNGLLVRTSLYITAQNNQGRSVDWRGIPAAICGAAARHKHSERKFMPSQNIFLQCPTLPSLPKSTYFLTVPPHVTDGCVTVGCVTVGRPAQTLRFELPPPPRVTDGCVTVGCVTVGRPAQTVRFELPPPPRVTDGCVTVGCVTVG